MLLNGVHVVVDMYIGLPAIGQSLLLLLFFVEVSVLFTHRGRSSSQIVRIDARL